MPFISFVADPTFEAAAAKLAKSIQLRLQRGHHLKQLTPARHAFKDATCDSISPISRAHESCLERHSKLDQRIATNRRH